MFMSTNIYPEHLETLERLGEAERKELVRNCVQAIIVLGQNQNAIKRLDLNKLVNPGTNYRIAAAVLQAANKEMDSLFGMRLFETEDKTKYILVNRSTEFATYQRHSPNAKFELTVLYFILVGIFTSADEKLADDEITKSLKPLDISATIQKSLLDSFVKKLYLTVEKVEESRFYRWGPRAIAEVDPVNFFNRFLDLTGSSSDKEWPDLCARIEKLKAIHDRS